MIYEKDINLLLCDDVDAFVHQCNCFHTMGAGIAKQIRDKYPEMYEIDVKSGAKGDSTRLGTFSSVKCSDGKRGYNLYSQFKYGGSGRFTSYDAVYDGLVKIKADAIANGITALGIPRNMGCTLGGGSWRVVRAIIDDIFTTGDKLDVYICNYDPAIQKGM